MNDNNAMGIVHANSVLKIEIQFISDILKTAIKIEWVELIAHFSFEKNLIIDTRSLILR